MSILSAFLLLLPFVLSPGASFALTISGAATGDRGAGLRVGVGTSIGLIFIALVTAVSGLSLFVASHNVIRACFELVGGLLLMSFGVMPLVKARRARDQGKSSEWQSRPVRLVAWSFVTVITNVKALAIYVIVVPSKIPGGTPLWEDYATVAAVHSVMVLVWLVLAAALVTRVPAIANNPRIPMALQALASGALILLGAQSSITGLAALL